jgi:diketogulonate reductase-like aldo/keto reductase
MALPEGETMDINTTYPLKHSSKDTVEMPVLGFGTWQSESPKQAVLWALKAGYLDCIF